MYKKVKIIGPFQVTWQLRKQFMQTRTASLWDQVKSQLP